MLQNPFLRKNASSQLALLSDEAYAAGLRWIESEIADAEARGGTITFEMEVTLALITGRRPG